MKKIFLSIAIVAAAASVILVACSKKVTGVTDNLAPLNPANIDLNAGTWKTVLLTNLDSFPVAVPAATSAASYAAELNEIIGGQKSLTDEQRASIKYWSAGAVLRWNEILRALVAKHNLPPYQNEDGTYPIPSSANPFNYPQYPFSNPPYAARAYAYVSAAQYDALVAAWHFKTKYNRPAPYVVDSLVTAMVPKTSLPSYPSEDAVLAGAMAQMMTMLFPTEISYIQQMVTEEEEAAILSGANVRSDVAAGDALGRQVASVFIARGKVDNVSKAVGTPAQWAQFVTTALADGQTPWYSLETPARNPMLPFFGNVKPFLFDSATVIALRPGPPPAATSDEMKAQIAQEKAYITNASRDQMSIVQFWADGAGTYTPPGHWNAIAEEDFITQNYSEVRWARNMALLNMSLMDAAIVCWNTKYYYFNPRPTQLDPSIKTLTGIPNFPSYISGHATFSAAAATILGHIVPARAAAYTAMAQQASDSRMYSGIHFSIDCSTGLQVGQAVGAHAVSRAQTDGAE
jgi:membrane-associated phospholipid phosphatase